MTVRTPRQEARERLLRAYQAMVDRLLPADEKQALRGGSFREWEQQALELVREVGGRFLEERAGLEASAQASTGGRCPHCGAERVYLASGQRSTELQTPLGPVVLVQQQARCRACGRAFSPSGPGLGAADRRAVESAGGAASGPGGGGAEL
jgi:hypothetical protein